MGFCYFGGIDYGNCKVENVVDLVKRATAMGLGEPT
jgi:hypothetical protein